MIIKWYNRDSISDVEMKQAKAVANRLSGKEPEFPGAITMKQLQDLYKNIAPPNLFDYQMVVGPSQYQVLNKLNIFPIHLEKKTHG